jgi:hypothetical protein
MHDNEKKVAQGEQQHEKNSKVRRAVQEKQQHERSGSRKRVVVRNEL